MNRGERRHYLDGDLPDPVCRLTPTMLRGIIVDPPEDETGIRQEDCGRCTTILRQRWRRALREQEEPPIRHYIRENLEWDQEPRIMCGNPLGKLRTPPVEPPPGPKLIQKNDCRTCVKILEQAWRKSRRAPRQPLEHIKKPDDLMTVLCGRRIDGLERPPAPYPAELPAEPSGQCRMCQQHWKRRERRPLSGAQWK